MKLPRQWFDWNKDPHTTKAPRSWFCWGGHSFTLFGIGWVYWINYQPFIDRINIEFKWIIEKK